MKKRVPFYGTGRCRKSALCQLRQTAFLCQKRSIDWSNMGWPAKCAMRLEVEGI